MKLKIIIICSLLMLLGCSLINGPSKPTPISFEDFSYPLEVGNSWTYERTISYNNIIPDTAQIQILGATSGSAIIVIIGTDSIYVGVDDTMSVQKELFILKQTSSINHHTEIDTFYALNEPEGMYQYGSQTGNVVMPISPNYFIKKNLHSASPAPVEYQNLKYPIKIDSEWLFVDESDYYFTLHKKIIGFEKLSTVLGSFDCFVVKWITPDDEYTMLDYISHIGLVKRTITVKNIEVTTQELSQYATADMTDEYILVDFESAPELP